MNYGVVRERDGFSIVIEEHPTLTLALKYAIQKHHEDKTSRYHVRIATKYNDYTVVSIDDIL